MVEAKSTGFSVPDAAVGAGLITNTKGIPPRFTDSNDITGQRQTQVGAGGKSIVSIGGKVCPKPGGFPRILLNRYAIRGSPMPPPDSGRVSDGRDPAGRIG
jgi:hypothetical protein